jgi:hypothetical protein
MDALNSVVADLTTGICLIYWGLIKGLYLHKIKAESNRIFMPYSTEFGYNILQISEFEMSPGK